MPELPEVETIRRRLQCGHQNAPPLQGRTIAACRLPWPGIVQAPSPRSLQRRLRGQAVVDIGRRGKYLQIDLDRACLILHLGMSGSVVIEPSSAAPSSHARLVLQLRGGHRLSFRDPRKFGRAWLLDDPGDLLKRLGPEPLDPHLTAIGFRGQLAGRRAAIKPVLLDQKVIAGIGNIYADESLHRAAIHPLTPADVLGGDRTGRLYRTIRQVLREAIRHCGTSFDYVYGGGEFLSRLRVYRRTGQPCLRCRTKIERVVVAGRGTHFCPCCQTT